MSVRFETWRDSKIHAVYRDAKGKFAKPKINVEIVDWLTKQWVNRKIKKFDSKTHKIFIADNVLNQNLALYYRK